jgi:hypothetical protein
MSLGIKRKIKRENCVCRLKSEQKHKANWHYFL